MKAACEISRVRLSPCLAQQGAKDRERKRTKPLPPLARVGTLLRALAKDGECVAQFPLPARLCVPMMATCEICDGRCRHYRTNPVHPLIQFRPHAQIKDAPPGQIRPQAVPEMLDPAIL